MVDVRRWNEVLLVIQEMTAAAYSVVSGRKT